MSCICRKEQQDRRMEGGGKQQTDLFVWVVEHRDEGRDAFQAPHVGLDLQNKVLTFVSLSWTSTVHLLPQGADFSRLVILERSHLDLAVTSEGVGSDLIVFKGEMLQERSCVAPDRVQPVVEHGDDLWELWLAPATRARSFA